ncbi:MAG: hypothetical protein R6V85_15295 [Polyangia bacterium]
MPGVGRQQRHGEGDRDSPAARAGAISEAAQPAATAPQAAASAYVSLIAARPSSSSSATSSGSWGSGSQCETKSRSAW